MVESHRRARVYPPAVCSLVHTGGTLIVERQALTQEGSDMADDTTRQLVEKVVEAYAELDAAEEAATSASQDVANAQQAAAEAQAAATAAAENVATVEANVAGADADVATAEADVEAALAALTAHVSPT